MSGKQEKRKRQLGKVISIAERRARRDFEHQVTEYLDRRSIDRQHRRSSGRVVLAVAALALIAAAIAWALGA